MFVSSLSSSKYWWKITEIEHTCDATANFCWSKTNLL